VGPFFFQEIRERENKLASVLQSIPSTVSQKQSEEISKLAGSEKLLNPHGDFLLIDMLVKKYAQYTHDDLYDMPLPFVEELIIINKKEAYIEAQSQVIKKQLDG
jgi:hypothetical protein